MPNAMPFAAHRPVIIALGLLYCTLFSIHLTWSGWELRHDLWIARALGCPRLVDRVHHVVPCHACQTLLGQSRLLPTIDGSVMPSNAKLTFFASQRRLRVTYSNSQYFLDSESIRRENVAHAGNTNPKLALSNITDFKLGITVRPRSYRRGFVVRSLM